MKADPTCRPDCTQGLILDESFCLTKKVDCSLGQVLIDEYSVLASCRVAVTAFKTDPRSLDLVYGFIIGERDNNRRRIRALPFLQPVCNRYVLRG